MRSAVPAERWAPRREELIGPPKRQRRWLRALVRASAAIVGVLGLPAGNIQLREGSG